MVQALRSAKHYDRRGRIVLELHKKSSRFATASSFMGSRRAERTDQVLISFGLRQPWAVALSRQARLVAVVNPPTTSEKHLKTLP